jgi:TatD DNase family protein
MLETDSPYLTPKPLRGQPNEPAYLRHIADLAATVFGVSLDDLAAAATANTREFYGLA